MNGENAVVPEPRFVRFLLLIAFGIAAALVIFAVLVPAAAVASMIAFVIGRVLGLANSTIGLLALVVTLPASALAIRWVWTDLEAFPHYIAGPMRWHAPDDQ